MRQQYKNGFWLKLFFYNMLHSSIFTRRQPNSTIKIDVFVFLFRPLLPSSNLVCSSAWNPFYTDSKAFFLFVSISAICVFIFTFLCSAKYDLHAYQFYLFTMPFQDAECSCRAWCQSIVREKERDWERLRLREIERESFCKSQEKCVSLHVCLNLKQSKAAYTIDDIRNDFMPWCYTHNKSQYIVMHFE